jgi:hypothetical protein
VKVLFQRRNGAETEAETRRCCFGDGMDGGDAKKPFRRWNRRRWRRDDIISEVKRMD